MKITAKLILLVLALVVTTFTSLEAQRGGRGGRNPADMAERQTKMMTDSLTLSTAQVKKVSEINLKYATMISEARRAARENMDPDGDREAMRNSMRAMSQKIQSERKDALKVILTSDQMAKLEKVEANRQSRRGERGKRGGKNGKRKRGKGKKAKAEKGKHEHGAGDHNHEHEKSAGENK